MSEYGEPWRCGDNSMYANVYDSEGRLVGETILGSYAVRARDLVNAFAGVPSSALTADAKPIEHLLALCVLRGDMIAARALADLIVEREAPVDRLVYVVEVDTNDDEDNGFRLSEVYSDRDTAITHARMLIDYSHSFYQIRYRARIRVWNGWTSFWQPDTAMEFDNSEEIHRRRNEQDAQYWANPPPRFIARSSVSG